MKKLAIWSPGVAESFEKRGDELTTAAFLALVALGCSGADQADASAVGGAAAGGASADE